MRLKVAFIGTGGTISSIGAGPLDTMDYGAAGNRLHADEILARVPEVALVAAERDARHRRPGAAHEHLGVAGDESRRAPDDVTERERVRAADEPAPREDRDLEAEALDAYRHLRAWVLGRWRECERGEGRLSAHLREAVRELGQRLRTRAVG